jgi:hypothetical protein
MNRRAELSVFVLLWWTEKRRTRNTLTGLLHKSIPVTVYLGGSHMGLFHLGRSEKPQTSSKLRTYKSVQRVHCFIVATVSTLRYIRRLCTFFFSIFSTSTERASPQLYAGSTVPSRPQDLVTRHGPMSYVRSCRDHS